MGGRPRGYDLRKIVAERLATDGTSVETVVYEVFDALRSNVRKGDTAAAKLILDRLCDTDPQGLEITYPDGAPQAGPPVPSPADLLAGIRKLNQLADELLTDPKRNGNGQAHKG